MRKIPTLYRRDPADMSRVLREVHRDCEWVFTDPEVRATRKYDGTCVMFDGTAWWARREVKPGKNEPANFLSVETDSTTGKTVGWEPIEQSAFAKAFRDANSDGLAAGTYELVGPKVNGDPESYDAHALVLHGADTVNDVPLEFDALMAWLLDHDGYIEGIVWHHKDGLRFAKLKVRDAKATMRRASTWDDD